MREMPQVLSHLLNQKYLQGLRFTALHHDHPGWVNHHWLVVEKTVGRGYLWKVSFGGSA